MANAVNTQILVDGERNAVVKITGVLDTSDVAIQQIVLPSSFSPVPNQFRIDYIDYAIADGLEIRIFWDAPTPVDILPIAGRGRMAFWNFGGLQNNAVGATGAIDLSTHGWATGDILNFSLVLEMVKQ